MVPPFDWLDCWAVVVVGAVVVVVVCCGFLVVVVGGAVVVVARGGGVVAVGAVVVGPPGGGTVGSGAAEVVVDGGTVVVVGGAVVDGPGTVVGTSFCRFRSSGEAVNSGVGFTPSRAVFMMSEKIWAGKDPPVTPRFPFTFSIGRLSLKPTQTLVASSGV